MLDDYPNQFSPNSNEDKAVEVEPENTESFSLNSDSEISTTVDNNSIKSAAQSRFIVLLQVV